MLFFLSRKGKRLLWGLSSCSRFSDWMVCYNMIDLGFHRPRFTWSRGLLFERIGRAVENSNWLEAFPDSKVFHFPKVNSDHRPLLVNFGDQARLSSQKQFQFLAPWVLYEKWKDFVNSS